MTHIYREPLLGLRKAGNGVPDFNSVRNWARARECELIVAVLTRIYQQGREKRDLDARLSTRLLAEYASAKVPNT